jgi:hypothetical protein
MEKLKDFFTMIVDSVPSSYNWEMDGRFSIPFVQLDIDDSNQVKESLSSIFENQWDSSSIGSASQLEKNLAQSFFGIQKGQILFTTSDDDTLLFCAWWPWGNGSNVSLRIGYFSDENGFFS